MKPKIKLSLYEKIYILVRIGNTVAPLYICKNCAINNLMRYKNYLPCLCIPFMDELVPNKYAFSCQERYDILYKHCLKLLIRTKLFTKRRILYVL